MKQVSSHPRSMILTLLLSKKNVSATPADIRPISLCNVLIYKNVTEPHFPGYIHSSQQAFVEGWRIMYNITIAQEITKSFSLSKWNLPAFRIKIDLAKAFERLE